MALVDPGKPTDPQASEVDHAAVAEEEDVRGSEAAVAELLQVVRCLVVP